MLKKNLIYIYYYAILIVVFMSWTDPVGVPNRLLMIAFLFAMVIPVYLRRSDTLPMVLSLFIIMAKTGVSNSYSPTDISYYLVLVIIGMALFRPDNINFTRPPKALIALVLFMVIINLISSTGTISRIESDGIISRYLIPFIFLLFFYSYKDMREQSIHLFSFMFILISLLLTFQFVILGEQYTSSYESMERIEWMDPNYFGGVLGMGMVSAILELRLNSNKGMPFKITLSISIALIIATMMLNASRGSIVSVAVCLSIIVLFSNIKVHYKLLAVAAAVLFCGWLYNNGYMDLLQYRIERDAAGANVTNERTTIWATKINAFFSEGNLINYFFGYGRDRGLFLGYGRYQGFHNDYVAFFTEYGILGFCLFATFSLLPTFLAKDNKAIILAGNSFLVFCSMSLEPFNLGYYAFFIFWLYLVTLTQLPEKIKFSE